MELGKQVLACSPVPFTAQGAGEAEQNAADLNAGLLLPASGAGFNGS